MNRTSNRLVETCLLALLFAGTSPAIAQVIEDQKLTASDGSAGFGGWPRIDGDTIVIGARLDDENGAASGSAYVFNRIGGMWVEQMPKLLASDGAVDNRFGSFVAIDGDTALIGATGFFLPPVVPGAAYVYHRIGGMWVEQMPKLLASDAAPDDEFGRVALDGNTAVVSALFDDDNGADAGAVYIFTRSNGIWTEQAKLLASDGAPDHNFGRGLAIDGDTLVVGANRGNGNVDDAGAAYIFTRTNGVWTEQAKVIASDGVQGDRFGGSNDIDGDTAVISSIFNDEQGDRSGAAYIFTRSNGNWTEQAKLLASDGMIEDQFGRPAISGNTVVIGAPRNDSRMGAVYIFTQPNGIWTEQAKVLASDGAPGDNFGRSSIDGTTLIVGGGGAVRVFSLLDVDFDGTLNELDNCPTEFNPGQFDTDGDGVGNVCDDDGAPVDAGPPSDPGPPTDPGPPAGIPGVGPPDNPGPPR